LWHELGFDRPAGSLPGRSGGAARRRPRRRDPPSRVVLALGKAYLAAGRGADALAQLRSLEAPPDLDPGTKAYLELLRAAAEALDGAQEAALARLDAVPALDPRMEHASRQLRRRIENARPPLIRF
jgi:hypothetical protein